VKHEVRIRVRFSDTDMNGHVNNAVYMTYMEEARIQFLEDALDANGEIRQPLILAASSVQFRAQTLYPNVKEVTAQTWVKRIGNRSFEVYCEIRTAVTGTLVAEGNAVVVYFDYADNCSVPIPDRVRVHLERYLETGETGDETR